MHFEAVKRIDALFDIERDINGLTEEQRLAVRQERSAPLLLKLEEWLREERSRLSRSASVAKPIDYMLRRWDRFARFIEDGRMSYEQRRRTGAARFCPGPQPWLFAGSERGAARAAAMATLIMTAKLNDVDPQAWLADVLTRVADTPQNRLHELLPWNWQPRQILMASAA
ncbi:transposase domain-containing protein [Mesorhizobium sp. M0040]|uniref:transposase domain-containing protein n=1 Tax=Mesorhizobium sp. M0040 TaxID=2956855 RepID=UPI00333D8548